MPADKLDKMVNAKVFSDTKDSAALECIAEWEGVASGSDDKQGRSKRIVKTSRNNHFSMRDMQCKLSVDHRCECNSSAPEFPHVQDRSDSLGYHCWIDFLAGRYTLIRG